MKTWSHKTGLLLLYLLKYLLAQLDYLRCGGLLKARTEQINWIDLITLLIMCSTFLSSLSYVYTSTTLKYFWLKLCFSIAMHCLWHGTPKDRKVIVKTMKTYVEKIAMGEFSHLVLLAAFDCIDDTKLVKQLIISEIKASLPDIINNKYGKKVLLYLLSPRDPAHFVPEIITLLQQGDGNAYSKKNTELRRHELLEAISLPLLEYLQEHTQEVVIDKATFVLVADILRTALGDIQPALDAIAKLAAEELVPGGRDGQLHIAEHPAGHLVLKWLIEQDEKMKESGKEVCFGRTLVEHVGMENLKTWAEVNRGAIILCCLLRSTDENVANTVKKGLKKLIPKLKQNKHVKGIEALLEKLTS